jgi:hypothetical protein
MSHLIHSIHRERLVAAKSRIAQYTFDGKSFNSSVFSSIFLSTTFHQWKEVPTSIRILFRPIGLALPSVSAIGELAFARKGVANGKKIGSQLEGWTHIFQSLVSNQSQWKFGFKKYYSLLYAAASISKSNSSLGIQQKTMRELIEAWAFPTLSPKEISVQKVLLYDIFGREVVEKVDNRMQNTLTSLRNDIKITAEKDGLYIGEDFISKAADFHDMLLKQPCLAISGNPMTGKSTIIRTVIEKINSHNLKERHIKIMYLDLDSNDSKDIFAPSTLTGKNAFNAFGIIPDAFKELIRSAPLAGAHPQQVSSCLVVDSMFGNEILERFLMDEDNRIGISLDSGEKLILPASCRIIIETSTVKDWSPVSLSLCPILCIPETMIGCRDILQKELGTFPRKLEPHRELFLEIFDVIIAPAIEFSKTLKSNIQSVEKVFLLTNQKGPRQTCLYFNQRSIRGFWRPGIRQTHHIRATSLDILHDDLCSYLDNRIVF